VIGNKTALAALAIVFLASAHARADGPTAADQTLAQTLFDEAVSLMDKGRFADACPKLAESQRLDPGGGTLLNLGFCRQNEGKLASAWAAYNEALSQAIKDGRHDREGAARVHVDELDGKVAKLAIDVTDAAKRIDQIAIRIDGTSVRQAAWGVLSPIDRGTHAIVVTAPGKLEFTTTIEVTQDGTTQRVSIPALLDAPVVVVDHDRGGERRGMSRQALVGWLTGGVGVALLGVGVTTGVLAIDARSQSDTNCPQNHCTQLGVDDNDRAKTYAWLSDFGVGLGAAAIVTGFILIVSAPKSGAPKTKGAIVAPMIAAHGGGMTLSASF
jgi:hypothetical protein